MDARIRAMAEKVMAGEAWFEETPVQYDRADIFLPHVAMSAKRVKEYIFAQKPMLTEESTLCGYLRFDGSVEGEIFNRMGHQNFDLVKKLFYNKPYDNLVTFEWQHSVGDFGYIIEHGISGVQADIAKSKQVHTTQEQTLFLDGINSVCEAIVGWAHICADTADGKAIHAGRQEYRENLHKMAKALRKVPEYPAENFYEAVLCIYLCYAFIPDSIGTIDRTLWKHYSEDICKGILTREEAKGYLQELFLMLQSRISINSDRFYRGGESHFCVGGYLPDGSDGFTELSRLIVESLMELPTCIPQISLRWTKKTPREVLRYIMDCERNDANKRIAFVNDEPRIRAFMEITGLSYEDAVSYCMAGCNEPALPGGRIMGSSQQNILRSMANTFHQRGEEIRRAETMDAFYAIYEEELFHDLAEILRLEDDFNLVQARDCNLVSSIFFRGCVENALSATQGGARLGTATLDLIGLPNVIDSLAVVEQFVYDEKIVSMDELVDAVCANWQGYELLHTRIQRHARFFGNDDEQTNALSRRLTDSIYRFLQDKRNFVGKKYLVGNLIGYNQHNKWFGERTLATPDGRMDGEMMSFGIGQGNGRDHNGLAALLNAVAQYDPHCQMNGPSVTNVMLDEQLVRNDESFEQLVTMFETYFIKGGTHFQLTYVSREDLIAAQKAPEKYRNLRVRVSGFSDFFVNLNDDLQNEIIQRTKHSV